MSEVPRFHTLHLDDLSLWVHLGCTVEERANVQEVRLNAEFRFFKAPGGTVTDRLQETICYAKVSAAIEEYCAKREFQLIEKMAYEIYSLIKCLGQGAEVLVSIHKVRPPVPSLRGGARYLCGDFRA